MGDLPAFVQFPHPGREHVPNGNSMDWNRGDHARKFLKTTGDYLVDGELVSGEVVLWGEWEAPSTIAQRFTTRRPGMPRVLHEPQSRPDPGPGWRQNTDPFVFGGRMLYTNCRQPRNRKLRRLAPGSIIAFGSRLGGAFVLDTLFVVGEAQPYQVTSACDLDWTDAEWQCIAEPLTFDQNLAGVELTRYEGRRYAATRGSGFSYVPCLPWRADREGFRRPAIDLGSRWITPRLAQAAKVTPATHDELGTLWRDITVQVERQGLDLAVRLDLPPAAPER